MRDYFIAVFCATIPGFVVNAFQQEDLTGLGRIVLALACNSALAVQSQNFNHAMELVTRNYSADLENLIG